MILPEILLGVMLFTVGTSMAGAAALKAAAIGLPLAWLCHATGIVTLPVMLYPYLRGPESPQRKRRHFYYLAAIAVMALPILYYRLGSQQITVQGELPFETSRQLTSELGFPVAVFHLNKTSEVCFLRSRDPNLVREALRRQGFQPRE